MIFSDQGGYKNTLHINGTNALDFLQALSDKNLISKIREQSKEDKEYFKERVGGAWLEDYLGVYALKIDLGIEVPIMNRDIAFGMLYRRNYPIKCRDGKDLSTKHGNKMTEKIKNITPITKKPTPTTALTTYKAPTSFAPLVAALTYLCENLMSMQVIQCWSQVPTPEPPKQKPKSKNYVDSCKATFLDQVKNNPDMPIANATRIRRNNGRILDKLDKISNDIELGNRDWSTIIEFLNKTKKMADNYTNELVAAYDIMNSTLYEAAFKLKDATKKAAKTNDEEDLAAVEIAFDEFFKTVLAAVNFDNEYHWAANTLLTVYFKVDIVIDLAISKHD
uniref:Uncharacterized protein n=1 Tax=Meloidogyne javanica TaxID=6303 RepID=A0A915MBW1_MELJA